MFSFQEFIVNKILPTAAAAVMLASSSITVDAQNTNIAIGPNVLQPSVKRFGMNLGNLDYYDAGQMMKSLVFRNPGFEGEIYNSTIRCASGTATSCNDDDLWSAWPAGFWNGATFEVFYGAAKGRTGTITSYSAANGSSAGGTFTFSSSGAALATGDYMIVRMTVPGSATAGWWPTTSGGGAITTNRSDLPPATTGLQTAAVNAPNASDSAKLTALFDGNANRSFLLLDGTFQLSFQAKGTGGSNAIALNLQRNGLAVYLNQTVTLTNAWATYNFTFTAAESGAHLGNVALSFTTVGKDSFLLDNVNLIQTNSDPSNTTAFRDPVVNALKTLNPGVIRNWSGQLGDTLDNLIADPFGRQRAGYWAFATSQDDISYGLHEFLQLCAAVGAEPWFVVPSTFSTADASNLIEYLAGSSGTPYGAKRASRGQPGPWTSLFSKIHLEFGNEAWNSVFKGGTIEYTAPYGQRAQAIFGAMRANPAYVAPSFDLVLGGQAVWAGRNQDIQNNCNNNDSFTVAPYMMNTVDSFSTNENLFGSTFAEAEAYVSPQGVAEGVTGGLMTLNQQALQASSHPVPLIVYEMNLSTLGGGISQAALNSYVSSLGAGLAVTDAMLQQMGQGVLIQNLWNLSQYNFTRPDGKLAYLWGAVVDMGVTDQRRPQYLGLQLANQAIGSNASMLQTVHSGANPTWNQPLINTVQMQGAHYLKSYAFSNGANKSVAVFNLHRTSSLPVTFSGANAPSGTVQRTLLTSANITDTNETASVVVPVTTTSTNFNPSAALSLPPYSMTILTWTGGGPTSNPPVITNVTVTGITGTSATISWNTDQAATSQVEYGATTSYGSNSALNSTLATSQSITLTGLTAGTPYDFAAMSSNAAGQQTISSNFVFTTTASGPVISGVAASGITTNSATITWTTNQAASSQVSFGTSLAYGLLSALGSLLGTSHSVTLTGLTPGTPYNYAVISTNLLGTATSTNFTFSTLGAGPTISSVISSGVTTTSATITWTTDQSSSSLVAFGTTTGYGLTSPFNVALVTSHSVTLTGLTPGTTYNFAVTSANLAGTTTSPNFTFSTLAAAPVISGVASNGITTTSATITWTTDQPSTSQVAFGTTAAYGTLSAFNSSLVTAHSVTLAGLTQGTTYNYAAASTNSGGSATSTNFTFTTTLVAPPPPPSNGISAVGGAHSNTGTSLTPTSLTIPYSSGSGNTVVAVCALGITSSTIASITDSGSTWTLRGFQNNGTAVRSEIWSTGAGGSIASKSFTINLSQGSPASCALEEYSGVQSIGATSTNAAISNVWSVALTTHDPNDYVVMGLGANSYYGYTAIAGTLRQLAGLTANSGNTYVEMGLCDNTAAAASTMVACTSVSGPVPWVGVALELRSVGGGAGSVPVISSVSAGGITPTSATITWTTDLASSSLVEFGTTTGYGSLSAFSSPLVTSHSVTLTGLTAGTAYNYAVLSTNTAGTATSSNLSFATLAVGPAITGVTSSGITSSSATVTWTTNQPTSSQVAFGTTTGYGSLSAFNSSLVTSHSVTLTGLAPGTTYNYAAMSTNSGGTATSSNLTFSTPALTPPPSAPVISAVASSAIATTSATITWTTDQPASSQIAFGTSIGYGSLSTLNSSMVTSHTVTLSGLTPGTTYYYAAMSTNSGGTTTSANFAFSTAAVTPPPAGTAIAPVGGAHNNTGTSLTSTNLSIPYTSSNGNTIVAVCAIGITSSAITSITDSGSTWTLRGFTSNGTAVRSEIWSTNAGGSVASTSFTVNVSQASPVSCALEEYIGVQSIGSTAANAATSGTWSVSLTTDDPNDYVVTGLGANSYYGYTAIAGTIRQLAGLTANAGDRYVETALCDNTAASASLVSCTSVSGSVAWAAIALELRATASLATGLTHQK